MASIRASEHALVPQYVDMFHRCQCRHCHSWVTYDEHIGRWFHMRRMQEELRGWSWDGSAWSHEAARG